MITVFPYVAAVVTCTPGPNQVNRLREKCPELTTAGIGTKQETRPGFRDWRWLECEVIKYITPVLLLNLCR